MAVTSANWARNLGVNFWSCLTSFQNLREWLWHPHSANLHASISKMNASWKIFLATWTISWQHWFNYRLYTTKSSCLFSTGVELEVLLKWYSDEMPGITVIEAAQFVHCRPSIPFPILLPASLDKHAQTLVCTCLHLPASHTFASVFDESIKSF